MFEKLHADKVKIDYLEDKPITCSALLKATVIVFYAAYLWR